MIHIMRYLELVTSLYHLYEGRKKKSNSQNQTPTVFNFFNLSQLIFIRNSINYILEIMLANFNCIILNAPEHMVPVDLHLPPLYIIFESVLNFLQNRVQTFYNFRKANFAPLY